MSMYVCFCDIVFVFVSSCQYVYVSVLLSFCICVSHFWQPNIVPRPTQSTWDIDPFDNLAPPIEYLPVSSHCYHWESQEFSDIGKC